MFIFQHRRLMAVAAGLILNTQVVWATDCLGPSLAMAAEKFPLAQQRDGPHVGLLQTFTVSSGTNRHARGLYPDIAALPDCPHEMTAQVQAAETSAPMAKDVSPTGFIALSLDR